MANAHTWNIFNALKKTNKKAANEYLNGADRRERINKSVQPIASHVELPDAALEE